MIDGQCGGEYSEGYGKVLESGAEMCGATWDMRVV